MKVGWDSCNFHNIWYWIKYFLELLILAEYMQLVFVCIVGPMVLNFVFQYYIFSGELLNVVYYVVYTLVDLILAHCQAV